MNFVLASFLALAASAETFVKAEDPSVRLIVEGGRAQIQRRGRALVRGRFDGLTLFADDLGCRVYVEFIDDGRADQVAADVTLPKFGCSGWGRELVGTYLLEPDQP